MPTRIKGAARILVVLLAGLLWACGRVTPTGGGFVTEGDTVNLAEAALLSTTTSVEFVTFSYADTGTRTERVDHVLREPAEIAALVSALNQPVAVGMAPACVATREVRFERADSVTVTFVYQCRPDEATFLRGATSDGSFQLGGEVVLPSAASEIVSRAFAASSESTSPPSTPPPGQRQPQGQAFDQTAIEQAAAALDERLSREQAETFAGLWLEQPPAYRIVVAFTRDGDTTLAPYVAGTPLEALVETRTAVYTLAELRATQQQTYDTLSRLGLNIGSGLDVTGNRVKVYVTDRALFDQRLLETQLTLPASVVVETIYTPLGFEPPFPLAPVPDVALPQLQTRSIAFMAALLQGTLVVRDGCLAVRTNGDNAEYTVLWQPDYYLTQTSDGVAVLDRTGSIVARVGAPIALGGGEVPLTAELAQQLQTPLPPQCTGPYWLMGELQ